jgi:hypothetical protein
VDIVCFPGGTGDSDSFDSVMRHNRRLVMRYLRQGGRYLGRSRLLQHHERCSCGAVHQAAGHRHS